MVRADGGEGEDPQDRHGERAFTRSPEAIVVQVEGDEDRHDQGRGEEGGNQPPIPSGGSAPQKQERAKAEDVEVVKGGDLPREMAQEEGRAGKPRISVASRTPEVGDHRRDMDREQRQHDVLSVDDPSGAAIDQGGDDHDQRNGIERGPVLVHYQPSQPKEGEDHEGKKDSSHMPDEGGQAFRLEEPGASAEQVFLHQRISVGDVSIRPLNASIRIGKRDAFGDKAQFSKAHGGFEPKGCVGILEGCHIFVLAEEDGEHGQEDEYPHGLPMGAG